VIVVVVLIGFALVAVVLGFMIASFFVRRHAETEAPQSGWTQTAEAFRDPSSGRLMRVWVDQSGARHYVPEANLPPEP
jgi:type II secretory pathway pseudopilin PulG